MASLESLFSLIFAVHPDIHVFKAQILKVLFNIMIVTVSQKFFLQNVQVALPSYKWNCRVSAEWLSASGAPNTVPRAGQDFTALPIGIKNRAVLCWQKYPKLLNRTVQHLWVPGGWWQQLCVTCTCMHTEQPVIVKAHDQVPKNVLIILASNQNLKG